MRFPPRAQPCLAQQESGQCTGSPNLLDTVGGCVPVDGGRRSRTGEGLFRGAGKGWGGGCTHCPLSIFVFWIKFWAATFIKVYNSAKENTALADPLSSLKIQVSPLGSSHRDYLPCPDSSPSSAPPPNTRRPRTCRLSFSCGISIL